MCFFITLAVPSSVAARVCAAHDAPGMSIRPTANPSAIAAAGAGRTPLLVTGGGCSCGWYGRPASSEAEIKFARARSRYQRLGWSRAKVDRALASMKQTARRGDGLHPVVIDLLRDVVHAHRHAAVWVHNFSGTVEQERYAIRKYEHWPLAKLDGLAAALDLDVRAEIHE